MTTRTLSGSVLLAVLFTCASVVTPQATRPPNYPEEEHDPHRMMLMGVSSVHYKQSFSLGMGSQSIRRRKVERSDASSPWHEEEREYTVAYFFTAWCGREGGDEIYLAGVKENGETVVEKWTFTVPDGRRAVRYPEPCPPLGSPAPPYTLAVEVKGGGAWEWKEARYPPSPQRTTVYEGSAGPFTTMDVDPEGRQLLLYDHTAKAIVRMSLRPRPQAPETLFEYTAYPHLEEASSIEIRDFEGEGRKALVRKHMISGSSQIHTILSDEDNDGHFESIRSFDMAAFDDSPYAEWPRWTGFWRCEANDSNPPE